MKNLKTKFSWITAVMLVVVVTIFTACNDDVNNDNSTASKACVLKPKIKVGDTTNACTITTITTNTTWTSGNVYILGGDVRVASGVTLTINAGTVIKGHKASRGTLVILRGGKISAVGTPTNPIVFTSSQPAGSRARQDWGGVIICGSAPNNQGLNVNVEGYNATCIAAPQYGGTVCADNSGTMKYVRIEYGGIPEPTLTNSEKNGLTLCSVGSGTTIDHIQVSFGGDDGFEWFGGTVNVKNIISFGNVDDDFDTDFGYAGKVQFGIALRDPAVSDASKSNGFESDNNGTSPYNNAITTACTYGVDTTKAIFSNFTLIGPNGPSSCATTSNFQDGLHIRRRSAIRVYNTLVVGWPRYGAYTETTSFATPKLNYNWVVAPPIAAADSTNTPSATPWAFAGNQNKGQKAASCAQINTLAGLTTSAWSLTAPNFAPSSALVSISTKGTNANAINSFFTANLTSGTNYYIGAQNTSGAGWDSFTWASFNPQTANYDCQ